MAEYLHELRPADRSLSYLDIISDVLSRMDNIGFSSPMERAKQFDTMIRQKGFQVLPAIPMPPERAIR